MVPFPTHPFSVSQFSANACEGQGYSELNRQKIKMFMLASELLSKTTIVAKPTKLRVTELLFAVRRSPLRVPVPCAMSLFQAIPRDPLISGFYFGLLCDTEFCHKWTH